MEKLYYFNIGFRSETTRKALEDYASGKPVSPLLMRDAEKLIEDCLRFSDPLATSPHYRPGNPDLAEFVMEIFHGKSFTEIEAALMGIRVTIKSVKERQEGVDIQQATDFFTTLSEKCLHEQHRPTIYALG